MCIISPPDDDRRNFSDTLLYPGAGGPDSASPTRGLEERTPLGDPLSFNMLVTMEMSEQRKVQYWQFIHYILYTMIIHCIMYVVFNA